MGKILPFYRREITEDVLRALREECQKLAPPRIAPPGATHPNLILLTPSLESIVEFVRSNAPTTAKLVGIVARGENISTCQGKFALNETPQVEPGNYDLIYFDGDGGELGRVGFDYVPVWTSS